MARRFDEQNITLTELSLRLPSLDQVFHSLTGAHPVLRDQHEPEAQA
jgi:oleandomycin transport system ATP-binding protein